MALGHPCGDGGGEGAAGAVRGTRDDPLPGVPFDLVIGHQDVHQDIAGEVAALDQRRLGAEFDEGVCRGEHRLGGPDGEAGQELGLIEVGGDAGREGEELVTDRRDRILVEQAISRRGDHDRVDHEAGGGEGREAPDHRLDDLPGGEHPGLDGDWWQVVGQRRELLGDHRGRDGVNCTDTEGILRGDGRDHGRPETVVCREGLQVGLDAGPSSGIGARNGQRDRS